MKVLLTLTLLICSSLSLISQSNVLWKYKTNGRVYSSPILDQDRIYFGSGDHSFYSLDKINGKIIWRYETNGEVHSTPFIDENVVYFTSKDGNLYALNKDNGDLFWSFSSEGEKMYGLWDYYISSPTVDKSIIYWGSGDGHLYAIDKTNGELVWKYRTKGILHADPIVYKDKVIIGGFDGYLYCLDKLKGTLIWKFKTIGATYFPKGEIQKAALVIEDIVYFGSRDYNIYAIDVNTGTGKWNMKQPRGWIIATPVAYKDNIYFGTSDAHKVYALNRKNGRILWEKQINMRVYGSATIHNEVVYFGTFDGKVLGFDCNNGELRWEFQTDNSKLNYSKIYDEKGQINDEFKNIYRTDFEESEKRIHALGSILSTPNIVNDTIYFGSSDGNLYAVKL